MSVTEERPQPTQPGERASTAAARVARPTRRRGGSAAGASCHTRAARASTTVLAARATGRRAAHSLRPNSRKLRATIQ